MSSNRPRRRDKEEKPVVARKKGSLNNMELLGIGLFCLALMLWGISKCGQKEVLEETSDPIVTEEVVDSNANANQSGFVAEPNPTTTTSARTVDTVSFIQKLYITTDSLRFRKEPKLNGAVVGYLKYGEEVTDLGERSVLEKIRISVDEVRTAPWVKIKTKGGKIGWAFAAYMQFYPVSVETNMPANEGNNNTN